MDEATSSMDTVTDRAIQITLRSEFKGRTVITVAHRIRTIMDSDKIIVMAEGQVREQGTPSELMNNPDGLFRALAQEAGESNELA